MPGLLSQQSGAPPSAAPTPATPAPQPEAAGEEQSNVTPEEQAIYDEFVDKALSAIYDDKSLPQIIESLKGDGNPVDGLANTAVGVVVRVQDSAEKAGQALTPDVVLHAGSEILEDLAGLAEKAGIHKFTSEEIEGAAFQAMDLYREMKGRDGGAARPQIVEEFNQVVALDQAGRIDEVAPGLTEKYGDSAQGPR
jgi:Glu-tRNA(Gln) amidotransferase subunit E-like FAD-binding protein